MVRRSGALAQQLDHVPARGGWPGARRARGGFGGRGLGRRGVAIGPARREPGPALAARLDEGAMQRARAQYELRQTTQIPTPPGVIRREQEELDHHVADALASVASLPARQVAFVPGASPPHTWVAYPLLHV